MSLTLLAQLPPPDFRWPRLDTNLPLAAGYLAAWARQQIPSADIRILPWEVADIFGDAALLTHILDHRPRRVGFSVYLWNAERTLHLARRLRNAGVEVILGGPEVTPDNPWLWHAAAFSHRIRGEGEVPLAALLRGKAAAGSGAVPDLARLPSPYLGGVLAAYPDGALCLETVRGCPYRCRYCNYGRRRGPPRHFRNGWLATHLLWAQEHGVREIYLMDPSFNVRPDWEPVLRTLEEGVRPGGPTLHTELVADALRPGDARRLAAAGLASCELGLQSTHPEVLAGANRRWQREAWLRGAHELLDAGVETVVGLILGLPEDTPEHFAASVEFLLRELPGAEIQAFPLAVLPDTELRADAAKLGLKHLPRPPYTVTETPGYRAEDLSAAFHTFEAQTGLELDPIPVPNLAGPWRGKDSAPYYSGIFLDAAATSLPAAWTTRVVPRAARNLTLWIKGWDPELPRQVKHLVAELPHTVLTLVLDDGAGWPSQRLEQLLATGSGEHYLDRCAAHLYGQGARLIPRLVALVPVGAPGATFGWQADVRTRADWVWSLEIGTGWATRAKELATEGDTVLLTGVPDLAELPSLASELGTDSPALLFADADSQTRWNHFLGDNGFRATEHRIRIP